VQDNAIHRLSLPSLQVSLSLAPNEGSLAGITPLKDDGVATVVNTLSGQFLDLYGQDGSFLYRRPTSTLWHSINSSLDGRFINNGDEVMDTFTGTLIGPGPAGQPYVGTAFLSVATNKMFWARANYWSDDVYVWQYQFESPVRPLMTIARKVNSVDIGFLSRPGYTYQLQSTTMVGNIWSDLGSPVTGNGGDLVISDASTNLSRFYRLVATPPQAL
ncbi:MAG: hypothetical protein WCG27_05315, partial [Pseudomonadota bacterium]